MAAGQRKGVGAVRAEPLAEEEENYDFGTGAGWYCNATQEPWKANYQMYSYVTVVDDVLKGDFKGLGTKVITE